jgi:UDP-2-acetamido-3-amino-2,3-dideoxy-glucuronate N-acetyltransferase
VTDHVRPPAVIEPGAVVGEGTIIWDLSHIRKDAVIGGDCTIGRNVFIDAGVVIGDRCKVQNNALIYAPAVVHDGVFIGPGVIVTNDRNPRAVTDTFEPKSADHWTANGVVVEEGAALGAGSVIVAGVTVGAWSMVAAGAVVVDDVAANALVAGVPARRIGWVGRAGVRLERDSDDWRCPVTGTRFVERNDRLEERL